MGPFRRRLIACSSVLASLIASPVRAAVCADVRPGWDGVAVGAFAEALSLFASPAGVVLLAVSIIALRFRLQWVGLAAVILWTIYITMVSMIDPTGTRFDAMAEGCIGPPTLFIVLAAAICVGIVLWTKPRPDDNTSPEA